jgi:hypothetical protein
MMDGKQPETAVTTLFRPGDELLVEYARFHRDRRNIHTHLVGIPLMVFGLAVLLSRPPLAATDWAGLRWVLTPAVLLWGLSTPWYLSRGLPGLGLLVGVMHAVLVLAATPLAQTGTAVWLGWGLGPCCWAAAASGRPLLRRPRARPRAGPDRPAGGAPVRGRRAAVLAGLAGGCGRRSSARPARRACGT